MNFFQYIDNSVLLFFQSIHSKSLDIFFWYVSEAWIFIPLWVWAIIKIYKKYNSSGYIKIFLILVLSVFISDQTSNVFKNHFKRLRPTHNKIYQDKIKVVNNYRGGTYGFYSAHASNSAAIAMLVLLILKQSKGKYFILIYPLLSGISRIYLGVHYFSDIITGWIMGAIVALFVYLLFDKYAGLDKI